jgi:predicted ArsR family transcriptional regulator
MALNTHLSNTTAYAAVVEALVRTGGTTQEFSDVSGLATNTTRKFIRALRNRGLVRVALWRQDTMGRYTIAVWGWGSAPDTKRPPRMTSTERSARRRMKKREMSTL